MNYLQPSCLGAWKACVLQRKQTEGRGPFEGTHRSQTPLLGACGMLVPPRQDLLCVQTEHSPDSSSPLLGDGMQLVPKPPLPHYRAEREWVPPNRYIKLVSPAMGIKWGQGGHHIPTNGHCMDPQRALLFRGVSLSPGPMFLWP